MLDLFDDLAFQTAVVPLVAGVAATGLLRGVGGQAGGKRLATAGIGVAFLATFALIIGLPAFPPPSSLGKLFWGAAAGLALGGVADALALGERKAAIAVAVWLLASLTWIALPALTGWADTGVAVPLLAVGAWIACRRAPRRQGEDGPTAPAAVLLALALAIGGTALIGSSAAVAQMAFGLAAATGGFLLWNWPVERHAWGVSGQIASGFALLLAAVLAFFTEARAEVLLLALPALFAPAIVAVVDHRLPLPDSRVGRALGVVAMTVLAVVPALAAIGVAHLLTGGEASPY